MGSLPRASRAMHFSVCMHCATYFRLEGSRHHVSATSTWLKGSRVVFFRRVSGFYARRWGLSIAIKGFAALEGRAGGRLPFNGPAFCSLAALRRVRCAQHPTPTHVPLPSPPQTTVAGHQGYIGTFICEKNSSAITMGGGGPCGSLVCVEDVQGVSEGERRGRARAVQRVTKYSVTFLTFGSQRATTNSSCHLSRTGFCSLVQLDLTQQRLCCVPTGVVFCVFCDIVSSETKNMVSE